MPGMDKATGRVVALVLLVVLSALALRGYLPGGERSPSGPSQRSPAALIADIALLTVTTAIVAVAIITRLRGPQSAPGTNHASTALHDSAGRPRWRAILVAIGVIGAWLLVVALLGRLAGQPELAGPPTNPESSIPPPADGTVAPAQPPSDPALPDTGGTVFGYLAATAVILLLLLVMAYVVSINRGRNTTPQPIADDPSADAISTAGPASLARAAELGLAEIGDLSREPREAIIACYAAMERELAQVPGAVPQDFDTPSEVLARAVDNQALRADNAKTLVELFAEARFSRHVMSERHREVAVRVLRLVLAELRSLT